MGYTFRVQIHVTQEAKLWKQCRLEVDEIINTLKDKAKANKQDEQAATVTKAGPPSARRKLTLQLRRQLHRPAAPRTRSTARRILSSRVSCRRQRKKAREERAGGEGTQREESQRGRGEGPAQKGTDSVQPSSENRECHLLEGAIENCTFAQQARSGVVRHAASSCPQTGRIRCNGFAEYPQRP